MLRQRWDAMTFLHWRYDRSELSRLLPPQLKVEEIDGSSWVGILAFEAQHTRLAALPAALPDFPETNVRTYVTTRSGKSAVWFFSLEAANPLLVAAARSALGLPYRLADMTVKADGARHGYLSRRRGSDVGHRIEVRSGPPLAEDEMRPRFEALTARYYGVVPRGGGLLTVPVSHPPWRLHSAELLGLEEGLLEAAGLNKPVGRPEVLFSPGTEAVLGLPRRG
jgi:uncharacterized protein YqjF (DUF2071 family)